jgi:hypothetical protein
VCVLKHVYQCVCIEVFVKENIGSELTFLGRDRAKFIIRDDNYNDTNNYCGYDCDDYLITVLAVLIIMTSYQIHTINMHEMKLFRYLQVISKAK